MKKPIPQNRLFITSLLLSGGDSPYGWTGYYSTRNTRLVFVVPTVLMTSP